MKSIEEMNPRSGSLMIYSAGVAKLAETSTFKDHAGWLKGLVLALEDAANHIEKLEKPDEN